MGHRIFRHASRFGYLLATFLAVLAFIQIVGRSLSHRTPYGLRVGVARDRGNTPPMWAIDPIVVTVRGVGPGGPVVLLVNSQEVPADRFRAVLDQERRKRPPEWPVYLEADSMLNWSEVVAVIDRIRGLGAEVSLASRRTRRSDAR